MDNRIENMFKRRTTDTPQDPATIATPNPDQPQPPPDSQSLNFMSLYQDAKKPLPQNPPFPSKTDPSKLKDSLKGLFGDRDFYGTFGLHSNTPGENQADLKNQG